MPTTEITSTTSTPTRASTPAADRAATACGDEGSTAATESANPLRQNVTRCGTSASGVTTSSTPTRTPGASTSVSVTPPAVSSIPEAATARGALSVDTGTFVVGGPALAGGVLPGTVDVTIADTRPDSTGWTAEVAITDAQGAHGNVFTPGPGSYYRAQNTRCSESVGEVSLRAAAVVVAAAHSACPSARWISSVGIAVPAGTAADAYTVTLTHSVY